MKKKTLTSNDIRSQFLAYFRDHSHEVVPSSPLIPHNDPTLLFTNAGMVQFKDVFLGKEERPYHRAASSQRCVRAGGKHNDLERVGYTARHHTFFEMLGNFSFGDYFKKDAIRFAWDFLINHLHLPPEKLWVTAFTDDEETKNIWLGDMKIDPARFSLCGEHDNFWAMGPTGPCGPCTEIFYDHGPHIPGGPPGSEEADLDRYVEIWNIVFMQYNRATDGTLTPLPKPSVDTGMGLERITAVMQGVPNNYDTDLFKPLISAAAKLAGMRDLTHFSLRVIADHIRSCSFLILDGVTPSNEGRGYVLRRIIRRALRHGHQLGLSLPFFYQLVQPLAILMSDAYPDLKAKQNQIENILRQEEEQFSATLSQGLKLFEKTISELKGSVIPGETVFKLYDTYGFPADLTADMAKEKHLSIDYDGFETEMAKQRERSREASQFDTTYHAVDIQHAPTEFTGHESTEMNEPAQILALYQEGRFIETLSAGQKGAIVLNRTPFYAESGGQVGDQGILRSSQAFFKVADTIKQGQTFLHLGKLEKGSLKIGDVVHAEIDTARRARIVLNHTATHLLHMVLRKVLGEHAMQKGSLVEPDRLRFDFAHAAPLTEKELHAIETQVNAEIRANHAGMVDITTPEEALASGALGLFGEKYGKEVRVVHFGSSVELCGGTHADHTGNIGFFKITAETGVASGIRRIEAVTGDAALQFIEKREHEFKQKLNQSENRIHQLEKEIDHLKDQFAKIISHDLAKSAKKVGKIEVLAEKVEGLDGKSLRQTIDHLKTMLPSAVIVLATVKENKIGLVGSVTSNLTNQFNAKDIVTHVAQAVGGKGGGRADLAEGGGNKPEALEKALQSVYTWVQEKIV
ncbi:MAG: alanine--tRNA ligase [Gammaproteobacteria bacterium RIFCSPHIGHO2_12_FULL_38_14]|nr:MAG: alanine--tRNA ligase [Gammaproteobacteria bacterium RIFCSPHIGHO2_12_FULL_38_14]